MSEIYLDYNASTPIEPQVAAAMRPLLERGFGNPSSPHWAGIPARAAVERARAQVAALGQAAELAHDLAPMAEVRRLRDLLWALFRERFGEQVVLNGHPEHRLPNTLNVAFVGRVGADLLAGLDGVAASTGSACHAGSVELSPVLCAMGVPPEVGMGAIRLSLGRCTTEAEVREVAGRFAAVLQAVPPTPTPTGGLA